MAEDIKKAVELWSLAGNDGHTDAQYQVGIWRRS